MEIWNILDKQGKLTGKTMKSEDKIIWQKGIYHQAADVWIINCENRILIQKRSAQKKIEPNVWSMTGGSVIKGETPLETIKRETLEELGVTLDIEKAIEINYYKNENVWVYEYIVQQEICLEDIIMQSEEVSNVRLATFDEIEKLYQDNMFFKDRWEFVRDAIKKHIENSDK